MEYDEIIQWLLQGDVSIRYQVCRDLLGEDRPDIRARISEEGWGAELMKLRGEDGHWGRGFYQPKWTSTHYTLQELRYLEIDSKNSEIRETLEMLFRTEKGEDGGMNPSGTVKESDICINGMALNYASYFGVDESLLHSVVDFILSQKMADGGFNCRLNRSGAKHSSLHTTISAAEGITEYLGRGYEYRGDELAETNAGCREFMLAHRLFKSDRTGELINKNFLNICWPARWYFDILRGLDYFRSSGSGFDPRIRDALDVLQSKRRKSGFWNTPAHHPGAVHFSMEPAGKPGRWNTLRALRVLKAFT